MTAERKPGKWVTGDAEDFLNDEGRPMRERKTEQPPLPKDIEEARYEGMGVLLGVIDMARQLVPPDGTPPRAAMLAYAAMVEKVARQHYGESFWNTFVEKVNEVATKTGGGIN